MLRETAKKERFRFDASRNDYITRIIYRYLPKNALLIALIYATICFGGTAILTLVWESFFPPDEQVIHLFHDHTNVINFLIVLPVAVVVVLNFYDRVNAGFQQIVGDRIIEFPSTLEGRRFLRRLDAAVNRRWFFFSSLVVATACFAVGSWNPHRDSKDPHTLSWPTIIDGTSDHPQNGPE